MDSLPRELREQLLRSSGSLQDSLALLSLDSSWAACRCSDHTWEAVAQACARGFKLHFDPRMVCAKCQTAQLLSFLMLTLPLHCRSSRRFSHGVLFVLSCSCVAMRLVEKGLKRPSWPIIVKSVSISVLACALDLRVDALLRSHAPWCFRFTRSCS